MRNTNRLGFRLTVITAIVNKGETNWMQQLMIYWQSIIPQHVSGVFTPIVRRSLPIVFCPVVTVVMLESRLASCVHCVE